MTWRDRTFEKKREKRKPWMSLTCLSICRIVGENCQGFLTHHHHHHCCSDDITIANFTPAVYFKLLCLCAHMHVCVCEWVCDRERNSLVLYVIQCVKAPIPISMIISYSLWAKTATLIQFISPLLTGAEMLGRQQWLQKSFRAERWQSLFYGWEEKATSTG